MIYFLMWALVGAVIGSFGTAYIHQITGRDVRMGGIIGALVGAIGSLFLLVMLWLWLYYGDTSYRVGKRYGPRTPWYRWWDF